LTSIHPTAIVSPRAAIGRDVIIGPFCVIEDGGIVGDRCQLSSNVIIKDGTTLGCDNQVHEAVVLGGRPQHLKAGPHVGRLLIGRGNVIREHATIHRGLGADDCTTVGDNNLIMVNAHIAHDCHVGSHTIIANNVLMAGHISVGDRAYLSGAVAIHQFCRIGQYCMVGGQAHVKRDVPPYVTVDGHASQIVGLNLIGLRRNGFADTDILQLKAAYRLIYRSGMSWADILAALQSQFPEGPAAEFYPFLSSGQRGFIQERHTARRVTLKLAATDVDEANDVPRDMRKAG
jgi:UDP-N-acetylglucosamine acyltransferase